MNKVFKVIWSEARNAYVVVSEMAKSHGTKSCSTKKLLAMLIATGVMTCASFDVLAAEPTAAETAKFQYVAFAPTTSSFPDEYEQTIGGHKYIYDVANQYWVREGYILVLEPNGKLHTPLSTNGRAADVAYTGGGDTSSILQSVTSLVSASGTVTNMGESLNSINASAYAGVSHSGGTKVAGTWNYIIEDSSWKDSVAPGNHKYGYVDLVDSKLPKGFKTAEDPNTELTWDDTKQCYTYKGNPVDYSNVYVIDGKIGVFTNKDGSKVYTGNVFGKNNEVLMTVKDANNKFYSYWASEVTDPSATMQSYRMADYEKDLSVLLENEKKLYRNDIKEVTLTKDENSATISLLRNGGKAVDGVINVTSGGGTGGSGAANDTFVEISNGTAEKTFATGSKVEAVGTKDATTGLKINGEAYTIKAGSVVSVAQDAANKTTTITVDGTATTITDTDTHNALASAKLDGKKLTITGKDNDSVEVDLASIDTDTKYTAGNGINISGGNNAIAVNLKEGENNLEVTATGLALKKNLTVDSVQAGATTVNSTGLTIGTGDKGIVLSNSNVSMGGQQIHNVAAGTAENDAVNYGQLNTVNEVANKGWKVSTNGGTATDVKPGDTVDFAGEDNIVVSNTDNKNKVVVKLGKDLTGLNSVTTNNAYVTNVDASKGDSVTNVEYVKNQITDAALSAGNGISITDKKINVKLKDGEQNLVVDNKGLAMNTALTGIESITGAGGTINLAGSAITINETTFNKDGRIQNVAAGTETKDAVNFGQLKKVSDSSVNVDFTNISNKGKTEIVNIAKAADVHVKDGEYSVQADGTVTMKYVDGNGKEVTGKELKITDVASAAKLDGLNTTVTDIGGRVTTNSTNITNLQGEVITSGSIGANGKVELTKKDGNKVEVGTVKDYSVTSGTYDQTTKKLTLTKTDAYGNATSGTVDIDLGGIQSGDKNWTAQANGTDVKPNTDNKVNFINGDNTNVTTSGDGIIAVNLNKDLNGIESVKNGAAKLELSSNPIFGATAKLTNGKASVELRDSTTIINGKVQVRQDGSIGGVTAGRVDNDAVNYGQLKDVKAEAGKHTTLVAGDNVQVKTEKTDNGLKYTVSATDTTYTAGNGIAINGENNAISVKLKAGEGNLVVDNDGLALNKDLQGIASISNGDAKLTLGAMGGMVSEFANGQGASVKLFGDTATINGKVNVYKDGRIAGVADGVNANDAVNVSQLQKVSDTANAGWNLSTNGAATEATNVKPGDNVDFSGDKNISVSNDGTKVKVELNKNLKDIESISNGGASLTLGAMGGMVTELANGQGASVKLFGDTTTINGKVNVYKDGRIAGVADGVNANDAVNVSQLQKAAAASAATVTDGVNTTVTTTTAEDGHVDYKVNLNKNLTGVESISNGGASLTMNGFATELANGQGASVKLFGDTTTINGKVNVYKDGRIAGVADGVNANDAVNVSQLQKAAAASATTVSDGVNTTVTATKAEDGHTDYKVNLNKDLVGIESISNGDAKLTLGGFATELANGQGASVKLFGDTTTINNAVTVYKDGRIAGVANGINDNDAVNVGQLNKVSEIANKGWNLATNGVATEATNVKPGDYVDFSGDKNISVSHDGTKVKVELNKDLDVNYVQTNALNSKYNLSVGTMAENGIMPFFVNSTGAFYAAHNKFSVDKDGNVNANSVQTNALNSKYNLSVGTANENGTVPFFVNSNGAFYAANGKLVVDKDGKLVAPEAELGKVTADEGVVGNVVLKDGVFYKHTALRDGELFVGDASGNYSQITTKGAKLGKVTIAEDGKISGVAAGEVSSTSTDAINGSQLHQTNVDVAQNKADIAQNKADIAANRADIDKNKADIAANRADIDKNKADIAANKEAIDKNTADISKLDTRVTDVEALAKKHTTVTAGDNITVTEDKNADGGKEYKVALDKDIKLDSVTTGQTVMNNDGLKVGENVSVTATAVTAGKTSISDEGVKVGDKTYISADGLNANDQKVTNVKAGDISETSKDAVNGSQLYKTNQEVANNTNRINQLGSRVNKVGAGAAALAALHPMDFDPDDKLTFSAGYGNYGGENAAAIGAYYRPDEKVMFSVAGTVGNGENMVNAGVSFALDRTNHVSNSRTALAREVIDLRGQLAVMGAKMAKMEKAFGMLDETKTKLFPDVPANHWAYEYIAKLAGNGYIEGYPDGSFGGDRLMTRYEFAAMLYRAIENGAALEEKIIKEFEPELGRIRVERISGEDGDRDKIERVRVNDTKGERDHYGNKLAK